MASRRPVLTAVSYTHLDVYKRQAHNGILNILDRYHALFGADPDVVISGFHMKQADPYTDAEWQTIEQTLSLIHICLFGLPADRRGDLFAGRML